VAPWLDDETLAAGLELALATQPRLEVAFTGGGVEGHYEAGGARLQAWAKRSAHADRITWHGWLPQRRLEALLPSCHIGVCLDRVGAEPFLGSRTRVLLYAWSGLHIAASPSCELVQDLVNAGCATPLPLGDPEALATRLSGLIHKPPPAEQAHAAAAWLETHCAPLPLAAPLVAFASHPVRQAPGSRPETRLASEIEALREQLAEIHRSPTWRALSFMHKALLSLGMDRNGKM
jgi:glycosyltransferase involved in cell wall biosynthesis